MQARTTNSATEFVDLNEASGQENNNMQTNKGKKHKNKTKLQNNKNPHT